MNPAILKPTDLQWECLIPLLLLGAGFVFQFLLEVLRAPQSRSTGGFWTLLISLSGIAYLIASPDQPHGRVVHQMWIYDGVTRLSSLIIFLSLAAVSVVVPRNVARSGHLGEYLALLCGAALGMVMLCGSNNLMVSFLSIELFSLALYLLCIFFPDSSACQESGLKYFMLSSLASAIMLYGMALVYGATGSTWLHEIATQVDQGGMLLMIGSALIAAGLAFKVSAVPFHLWTPDVYQGAPSPVTAFMSVATKVAALTAMLRFFPMTLGTAVSASDSARIHWWIILWSLAILSMLFGNLMALSQTHLKRMLAYSGIAQGGYMVAAVFVGNSSGQVALFYYLLVYLCMNLGAFVAVSALEELGEELTLPALSGLSMRHPLLSASLAVCLFSLTGLPPTAGFLAKFQLFSTLLAAPGGLLPRYLLAAGLVGSLLSAAYYLKFLAQIYSPGPAPQPRAELPSPYRFVLALSCFGVLGLFFWAQPCLAWIQQVIAPQ